MLSFVTNENGDKTSVIIPVDEYEALLEDLADMTVAAGRSDEPTSSLEDVVTNLKQDGLLD
jgi:PHD/YefM family antitoxin component YafN of YafNO toxin-antitoxin module